MRRPVQRRRFRLLGLAAVLSLAAAGPTTAATPSAKAASAAITASVSVDTGRTLTSIPATGVGTNVAVYDGNMNHSAVPGLLKDATSIGSATTGSATRQNVPAYSIVVVQLHRAR